MVRDSSLLINVSAMSNTTFVLGEDKYNCYLKMKGCGYKYIVQNLNLVN